MSEQERRLFKKLTADNWLSPDETARHIVQVNLDGSTTTLTRDDWAGMILEQELKPPVPNDIRNMFEVAQGVLCYGCFFYPLYTLGSEQLYRVLEAAIMLKCKLLNAPNRIQRYADALIWLKQRDEISDERYCQFTAARQLRNHASHADWQSLYDPTMAIQGIALASELITVLYSEN